MDNRLDCASESEVISRRNVESQLEQVCAATALRIEVGARAQWCLGVDEGGDPDLAHAEPEHVLQRDGIE